MIRTIFLYFVLLSLVLGGCKPKVDNENQVETSDYKEIIINPGQGFGSIKFGMTKEQVIELLGSPDQSLNKGMSLIYASKGFSLLVTQKKGLQIINCYAEAAAPPNGNFKSFQGTTKEGITIGSSREELIAAYGNPDKEIKTGQQKQLDYSGISFYLLDGKVVQFIIMPEK